MGKKNSFFKQKILTPVQQLYYMQMSWPGFSVARCGRTLIWQGQLTPDQLGSTYTIRVTYKLPIRPEVEVLAPKLQKLPDQGIPHRFSDGNLCLHLPGEWHGGKIIAHTVLHWAAFWLYFYEAWLITEKWEGGGHEPPSSEK